MRQSLSSATIFAALFAVSFLSGCGDDSDRRSDSPRSSKPKAAKSTEPLPVPKVIEIDPSTLPPEKREHYDRGFKQGQNMAEGEYKRAFAGGQPGGSDLDKLVKDWQETRDVAIQAALQKAGSTNPQEHRDVLEACGRKAGFKAAMAKHNVSM